MQPVSANGSGEAPNADDTSLAADAALNAVRVRACERQWFEGARDENLKSPGLRPGWRWSMTVRPPDRGFPQDVHEIAEKRRRFGYCRIGVMLESEGGTMNQKKL